MIKTKLADLLAIIFTLDFVERIVSLSLRCLFSGASFQRKKTGMPTFKSLQNMKFYGT